MALPIRHLVGNMPWIQSARLERLDRFQAIKAPTRCDVAMGHDSVSIVHLVHASEIFISSLQTAWVLYRCGVNSATVPYRSTVPEERLELVGTLGAVLLFTCHMDFMSCRFLIQEPSRVLLSYHSARRSFLGVSIRDSEDIPRHASCCSP